jgi:hypothetical protein
MKAELREKVDNIFLKDTDVTGILFTHDIYKNNEPYFQYIRNRIKFRTYEFNFQSPFYNEPSSNCIETEDDIYQLLYAQALAIIIEYKKGYRTIKDL